MTELIKITTNESGSQVVSARELHQFLEIDTRFNDWITRMMSYGFVENVDYQVLLKNEYNLSGGRPSTDYALTLDTAKEISMIQRTEKGKLARQYFIECEKKLREVVSNQQLYIPKTLPEALRAYADEVEKNEKLIDEIKVKNVLIAEYEPKVTYYDQILASVDTITITQIAKDYGMSAQELNKLLHEQGIQYKQNKQWILYQKYAKLGYTKSKPVPITYKNGEQGVALNTQWTQKGRLFLYELLKNHGYLPLIEQDDENTLFI